ncbi:MAG TPA: hypothetical protein EYO62_03525 [Aquificales bacterium]|nr:hypothetical protein [Aquificales bacterium]HIO41918.1 hypothetical protein [Aquifex sp.]
MSKIFLLLVVVAVLSLFLQQFVEALFITTVLVFAVFFFLGLVFFFQGLTGGDTEQLITGLAIAVFSASYIMVSYYYMKRRERDKD